jgi:hypothetical protein
MKVKGDAKDIVSEIGFFSIPNEYYSGWIRTKKGVYLIQPDGGIVYVNKGEKDE